jgi:hypothetical protein
MAMMRLEISAPFLGSLHGKRQSFRETGAENVTHIVGVTTARTTSGTSAGSSSATRCHGSRTATQRSVEARLTIMITSPPQNDLCCLWVLLLAINRSELRSGRVRTTTAASTSWRRRVRWLGSAPPAATHGCWFQKTGQSSPRWGC